MLGLDTEIGTSALRLWVGAGSAALLIFFCGLAFRSQSRTTASATLGAGFVILAALFGAALTWAFLDRTATGDRSAERRAFELSAAELSARALAPGSPLACLDALAGENVEAACEKALFVSPASVAAASSYVAARLNLLSGMAAYAQRGGGADIEYALLPLRRALETDRFGFLAHVLVVRDGCTSQNCKALALLRDASRVRANLSAQMLDRYLERYQEVWAKASDVPSAEVAQLQPGATAQPNALPPRKLVNIDFPSAASIPPVSIMNAEPKLPPAAADTQAAQPPQPPPAEVNVRVPPKRPQAQRE